MNISHWLSKTFSSPSKGDEDLLRPLTRVPREALSDPNYSMEGDAVLMLTVLHDSTDERQTIENETKRREYVAAYCRTVADASTRHEGDIVAFLGPYILSMFGLPEKPESVQPTHAAFTSAATIRSGWEIVLQKARGSNSSVPEVSIVITGGNVWLGPLGSESRRTFAPVGYCVSRAFEMASRSRVGTTVIARNLTGVDLEKFRNQLGQIAIDP